MDEDGFTSYVAARWSSMVRSLVALGCEPHEAEDVTQAALIRCYARWDRVSRADDVDAYVFRTLLNTWAKSRRRRWWGERPTGRFPETPGAADAEAIDVRDMVERALGGLSTEHRAVLVLRYLADLSEHQTAEILGIPVGTVKSRSARALAAIDRTSLQEGLS